MSVPNCRHNPYAGPTALAGSMVSAACGECMAEFDERVRRAFGLPVSANDAPNQDS